MSYELILGDCLEVMPTLPDASVDAVVTDPPYGQTNESYDRGTSPEVWAQLFRVCKPNAALLSFAGSCTYHRIAGQIEAAGWQVRQMWAWVYRNGFITSAYPKEGFDRLAPSFDPICYATKGKVLLQIEREGVSTWQRKRNASDPQTYSSRASSHGASVAKGHYPRTIVAAVDVPDFEYFILNPNSPGLQNEWTGHPNQKPLALMVWLVAKLPANGIVLDPFMGSGTTGAACLNTGRRFIGIEEDRVYFEVAQRRLEQAAAQLRMAV